MISQQYRHGKRRLLGTSLFIYIDSLYIYSTIFIIYNLVTYYTRGHVGIQVIPAP